MKRGRREEGGREAGGREGRGAGGRGGRTIVFTHGSNQYKRCGWKSSLSSPEAASARDAVTLAQNSEHGSRSGNCHTEARLGNPKHQCTPVKCTTGCDRELGSGIQPLVFTPRFKACTSAGLALATHSAHLIFYLENGDIIDPTAKSPQCLQMQVSQRAS